MLGYSDLLSTMPLNPEQSELAAKIGQQTRRAKSLVASLLNFAKQGPAVMTTVNINTVLRTALRLAQPQAQGLKIEVGTDFDPDLPPVYGDSNQLLQVCVQTFNNALHAVNEAGGRKLVIAARHVDSLVCVEISDARVAAVAELLEEERENTERSRNSARLFSGLGLSACQNVLQQHKGRILWSQHEGAGASIRIELPAMPVPEKSLEKSLAAGVPVMWESQPSA
jgi:two-component system NtrC family sensor kinase